MYRRGKWQRELQRNKIHAAEKLLTAAKSMERADFLTEESALIL